jgi:hypothetical protein
MVCRGVNEQLRRTSHSRLPPSMGQSRFTAFSSPVEPIYAPPRMIAMSTAFCRPINTTLLPGDNYFLKCFLLRARPRLSMNNVRSPAGDAGHEQSTMGMTCPT